MAKFSLLLLFGVLIFAGCSMESLDRSDKPISRAKANGRISFNLPASARDIYFVTHADGMQEFQEYVRFAVDPSEMDATVHALLAGHSGSPPAATYGDGTGFASMPWWTPASIAHGEHHATDNPPIYIWTDTDNHLIFVHRHD